MYTKPAYRDEHLHAIVNGPSFAPLLVNSVNLREWSLYLGQCKAQPFNFHQVFCFLVKHHSTSWSLCSSSLFLHWPTFACKCLSYIQCIFCKFAEDEENDTMQTIKGPPLEGALLCQSLAKTGIKGHTEIKIAKAPPPPFIDL